MRRLLIAPLLLWLTPVLAADGALDTSFGVLGRFAFTQGSGGEMSAYVTGVMLAEPNGTLLAVGSNVDDTCHGLSAQRISNNALVHDASYGNAGTSIICFDDLYPTHTVDTVFASGAAVVPGGKIVVGTGTIYLGMDQTNTFYFLLKLNDSGQPVAGFGNAGRVAVTNNTAPYGPSASAIAVRNSDGAIFVVGEETQSFSGSPLGALRVFDSSGNLQTSLTEGSYVFSAFHAVAIQPDGKIVIAGISGSSNTNTACLIERFIFQSGLLVRDTTFNGTGRLALNTSATYTVDSCNDVALQPDGKILVTGQTDHATTIAHQVLVARLTSAGALDTSFGSGGSTNTYFENNDAGKYNSGKKIAVLSNGKILIGGMGAPATTDRGWYDFGVLRYSSTGLLDNSFVGTTPGSNIATVMLGFEPLTGGPSNDTLASMLVQNGNIVLFGNSSLGASVARLVGDDLFASGFQ